MATQTRTHKHEAENANGKEHTRSNGRHAGMSRMPVSENPISDLMYDWLTVLQAKAEAINAYEKYIQDAEEAGDEVSRELFHKVHEQDVWQVKEIKQHLELMFECEMEE